MTLNRKLVLDNRPQGEATVNNFRLVEETLPALQDGQVLIRHHFLSLDPYMPGRMNDSKSLAVPQAHGVVMYGATAGYTVESRVDNILARDPMGGMGRWACESGGVVSAR